MIFFWTGRKDTGGNSMNKITRKIHRMLKEWDKLGFSPMAINTGCCEEFAKELQDTFHKKSNGHLTGIAMWGMSIQSYLLLMFVQKVIVSLSMRVNSMIQKARAEKNFRIF